MLKNYISFQYFYLFFIYIYIFISGCDSHTTKLIYRSVWSEKCSLVYQLDHIQYHIILSKPDYNSVMYIHSTNCFLWLLNILIETLILHSSVFILNCFLLNWTQWGILENGIIYIHQNRKNFFFNQWRLKIFWCCQ